MILVQQGMHPFSGVFFPAEIEHASLGRLCPQQGVGILAGDVAAQS
jgi:hypothetical protein